MYFFLSSFPPFLHLTLLRAAQLLPKKSKTVPCDSSYPFQSNDNHPRYNKQMTEEEKKLKDEQDKRKKDKDQKEFDQKFIAYYKGLYQYSNGGDTKKFCENSVVIIKDEIKKQVYREKIKQEETSTQYNAYIPAYVRCHFRNMTEMDIQNLSCKFVATMNVSIYLGSYESDQDETKVKKVKDFAEFMSTCLLQNLKITFQNDFVLDIGEDLSTNISDSDRIIRSVMNEYKMDGITRIYRNFIVTRQFKFGLRSDILFFPLEQNDLDMVTTLNPIKITFKSSHSTRLTIRFNCMNLEFPNQQTIKQKGWQKNPIDNNHLMTKVQELYMHQKDGKELGDQALEKEYVQNKNNTFFRNVKISFPLRKNSTQFGYYNLVEDDIKIHYTNERQQRIEKTPYENKKNCLFCRKQIPSFSGQVGYNPLPSEDRSLDDSFCNTIMRIPMLKASIGTIIQLCIPIFFLSFLCLVEFLYSQSTSGDIVRGQKIGSSTLIVATYISFIYAMRSVIPPTPSWSIFEVAVCILAGSSLFPIIESIYATNYKSTDNPFIADNGLFIATFTINTLMCLLIIIMLICISCYKWSKTNRKQLKNVKMDELLENLTREYFFVWRNAHCYDFMRKKMEEKIVPKQKSHDQEIRQVRYQQWREKK